MTNNWRNLWLLNKFSYSENREMSRDTIENIHSDVRVWKGWVTFFIFWHTTNWQIELIDIHIAQKARISVP